MPPTQPNQAAVLDALPGTAATTCAVVGSLPQLRAGGIGVADFVSARTHYREEAHLPGVPSVNLFVIPRDAAGLTRASVSVVVGSIRGCFEVSFA